MVTRAESFQRIVKELPLSQLLTETDCPYMGPDRDARNEPANVPRGVEAMARVREMDPEALTEAIRDNFRTLFRR